MRLLKTWIAPLALPLAAACGGPSVEIDAAFLEVVHASPHHGAIDVDTDVLPLVGFSAPVSPEQMEAVHLEEQTADEEYAEVDVRRVPRNDDHVVMLVPRELLDPGAQYRLRVAPAASTKGGPELPAEYVVEFVTAAE